ncbi:hypothetical protein E6H11_05060 [Candidatus Bathyarchaeota archaeon]|nr:MAG: hypothetical protein E6H11_05060 [Candidatus Bathyarchaeota archaeon]
MKRSWKEGLRKELILRGQAIPGLLMGSYDDLIINLANGLARQLDLSGVSFSSVMWQQGMVQRNRGRIATIQPTSFIPIPSDGALFRNQTIYLAQNMEGKLSVDEWKPLIASALINQKKLRRRKITWITTLNIPIIGAYVVAWILLPPLFPTTTSCANGRCAIDNPAWNVLVIIGAFLTIGLLIFSVITLRRFKWIADNETATLFGRDQLITSLRRVSEVSPSDDWNVQRRIGKLSRPEQTTT